MWVVCPGDVAAGNEAFRSHHKEDRGDFLIARRLSKNGSTTKACITETKTSSMGFRLVFALYQESFLEFTYISICGNSGWYLDRITTFKALYP